MARSDSRRGRRSRRRAAVWAAGGGLALALAAAGCAGTVTDNAEAELSAATAASSDALVDGSTAQAKQADPSPDATDEPLVTATPDSHSEVGDLVAGFPIDLLPVPADAVILVTSAVPVGDADVQEVSLNLRTAATTQEVLDMYRTTLTAAGFTEIPETGTGLSAGSTFTRSGGDELVSIGVLDTDGARTVTIGGRVHTAG